MTGLPVTQAKSVPQEWLRAGAIIRRPWPIRTETSGSPRNISDKAAPSPSLRRTLHAEERGVSWRTGERSLEKYRLTEMRARVGQLLNEFGLSKQLVVAILGQLIPAAPFKCPGQKIGNAHGS